MKALTLWQPWASFMLCGPERPKRNETRPWRMNHRGPLAIQAAKSEPGWVRRVFTDPGPLCRLLELHLRENLSGQFFVEDVFRSLPRGAVLGVVELVDCFEVHEDLELTDAERLLGDYSAGRFVLPTRNARRLATPVPHRGCQGLWTLPDEALAGELLVTGETL